VYSWIFGYAGCIDGTPLGEVPALIAAMCKIRLSCANISTNIDVMEADEASTISRV
jgi:hypothetical protein